MTRRFKKKRTCIVKKKGNSDKKRAEPSPPKRGNVGGIRENK